LGWNLESLYNLPPPTQFQLYVPNPPAEQPDQ
jgi:hypothetical protein